jgi:hypothetical protein
VPTQWLPRKATLDAAHIRALPDALKRWVRAAGRKEGLAASAIETMAAIDRFGREFQRAMRDPSRFGPARSLVDAMTAEGVDLTDQAALAAWIEDLNSRPVAERDAIPGGASLGAVPIAAGPHSGHTSGCINACAVAQRRLDAFAAKFA